ncbi:MAG: hypothetical protein ACUVV4_01455 [Candidatus Bathyarchaeia archaeon]
MEENYTLKRSSMCVGCEYFNPELLCSRRKGCYIIPAIVRLDRLLRTWSVE